MNDGKLRGVDGSFDALTLSEAQCLKDSGVELYAQALWTAAVQPDSRVISLRNAVNAGLPVAGYIALNGNRAGTWHVERGRAGVPMALWDQLAFIAIDIELDNIDVSEILDAVDTVERLGQRPIIYTNYNSWMTKISPRNSTALSRRGVLLWNALWDNDPDIDFPHLPFGGWSLGQVIGEQWSGGTMQCGQFVDRNTFVRELLFPKTKEEDEEMAEQEETRRWMKAAGYFALAEGYMLNRRKVPSWLADIIRYLVA